MPLRILIVHEFGVARKITYGYLLTELGTASVDLMASPLEAVQALDKERYDVVLCGLEMAGMDGLAVFDHMRKSSLNRNSSFVIMTASYDEAQRQRLSRYGIRHILPIPFTALQLRDAVIEASDLRSRRIHPRYAIPHTRAILHLGNQQLPADVVNISLNGILCMFIYPKQNVNLLDRCRITVQFPAEYDGASIDMIVSQPLRLLVQSYRDDYTALEMKGAWTFVQFPEGGMRILEDILDRVRRDLIAAEEAAAKSKLIGKPEAL